MTYPVGPLSGRLSGGGGLSGGLSLEVITAPSYDGPYEYTPTQSTQTVQIDGKQATQDIIINPIPSNYGLVQWNGAYLMIS